MTVDPRDLETWAGHLLDHSLGGVGPGDRVMLKGERIAWPLLEILERRVIQAGAVPDVLLVPPNNERGRVWSAAMARWGGEAQLAAVPDWLRQRYEAMNKYIEVLGAEDPTAYAGLDGAQTARLALADRPLSTLRLQRRWVITLYPTAGFAATEGLSLDEYERFIVRASTTDPRPLLAAGERVAPHLGRARQVTVVTRHPSGRELTLTLGVDGCRPTISYGLRNFPDGEVFTSPDARTPEGEIHLDLPVHYGGGDIAGITLKLAAGRIVDYDAVVGRERLAAIVETDEGSHRLGEIAFGLNPGLDRVLKHPLYVEKVGGTLHIAIGASYDHAYVEDAASEAGQARLAELVAAGACNRSAQHVDVVCDFRPGGAGRRVFLDDVELVSRDGSWHIAA